MNERWNEFLELQGARLDAQGLPSFDEPRAEARAALEVDVLCDLSHLGLIAVSGVDAQSFLQGQLINDVRLVDDTQSQITAHCSAKGRMLATFRLFLNAQRYCLSLPRVLVEPALKRLRMFVLRAQVVLEDASDHLLQIGLSGPHAPGLLTMTLGLVPERVDQAASADRVTIFRLAGPHPRFQLCGPFESLQPLWVQLAQRCRGVGGTAWKLMDIEAGIPTVYPATVEAFVPQMANLQLLQGVSFHKGCYPGQEVVARMQYLGKLKRRMYRAHIDAPVQPVPGEELFSADTEAGQDTGRVVDAQPAPEGGYVVLVVVQAASVEHGSVHLGGESGPLLQFRPLSYPLES